MIFIGLELLGLSLLRDGCIRQDDVRSAEAGLNIFCLAAPPARSRFSESV
jgi:hypothetical protein